MISANDTTTAHFKQSEVQKSVKASDVAKDNKDLRINSEKIKIEAKTKQSRFPNRQRLVSQSKKSEPAKKTVVVEMAPEIVVS